MGVVKKYLKTTVWDQLPNRGNSARSPRPPSRFMTHAEIVAYAAENGISREEVDYCRSLVLVNVKHQDKIDGDSHGG